VEWLVLLPVILIVLLAVWLMVSYNRFVRQRNLVQESWRQIDVELQRRHDLIPNLVETVKAFAAQERNVLVSVIEARNRAEAVRQSPGIHAAEQAQAEGALQRAVGGLFAVAEAYPDLKSNQNFLALQQQLAETEDRIAAGRRFYNANVRAINTRVEAFPSNMVANAFKFAKEEYFEVDDPASRAAVQVDFSGLGQIPAGPGSAQQQANVLPPGSAPSSLPPGTPPPS
jgi:LemA protein